MRPALRTNPGCASVRMIAPPTQGAVEVGPRLGDLTEPLAGHGQEEQVESVGLALAGRETLLQGGDGLDIPASAVLGTPSVFR